MHSSKPGNQKRLNITGKIDKEWEALSRMFSWTFAVKKVCECWNHLCVFFKYVLSTKRTFYNKFSLSSSMWFLVCFKSLQWIFPSIINETKIVKLHFFTRPFLNKTRPGCMNISYLYLVKYIYVFHYPLFVKLNTYWTIFETWKYLDHDILYHMWRIIMTKTYFCSRVLTLPFFERQFLKAASIHL